MSRRRGRVAIVLASGAWIAAFVALWALAGCLAILVYRVDQIGAHRCLGGLPLPAGYLQVGVCALALASALGVGSLLADDERGPRLRRAMIAGTSILGTLLLATLVTYSMAPPAGRMGEDACTGSNTDYLEGST